MAWQRAAWEIAKRGASTPAGKAAITNLGPAAALGAVHRGRDYMKRRSHRTLAIELARQVKGQYSERTIVSGRRRFVVWKDGKPIAAFPPVDGEVSERAELLGFDTADIKDPPPVTSRA
jgi:hypothetical protein